MAINRKINKVQWFDDYLTTIFQRDVRNLENIKKPEKLIQLLVALSQRAGTLLNNANVINPVQGQGKEVDFIVENTKGETIAIEITSDSSLKESDFTNIAKAQAVLGKKMLKGIVIYLGNEIAPFGKNLWAIPANYLWQK